MRLHPAESRIRKLAAQTPATFILFDILAADGKHLMDQPLTERRRQLEAFHQQARHQQAGAPALLKLSPFTRSRREARDWLKNAAAPSTVWSPSRWMRLTGPGERVMIKVKCLRTADCVVGGFRYGTGSDEVGSLLLGLYNDDGKLDHVGFTSTISRAGRPALTKRLEALIEPPGFTGNAPGGPSRWSTERSVQWQPLKLELVVEVRFDHVSDGRFRHGTKLLRWRPDKAPRQCTYEQIAPTRAAHRLTAAILKDAQPKQA